MCSIQDSISMAPHILLPIWLALFLIPILLLIKKKIDVKRQTNHLPPSPPKLPIIGNLHQLGPLPHQSLWELSKNYGPVMLLQLGAMPTLVVSSAKAAKEILKTHDLDCCSRPVLVGTGRLSYNFLDIAFSPYGDYWREIRKLCAVKLFSATKVQSFQFIREEEVALLIDSLSQSASSAAPVDLSQKFLSVTTNIICRIAFGERFLGSEIDNARFIEIMRDGMAMLGRFSVTDFFPYVGWIFDTLTGFNGRLERTYRDLDALYQQVIDHHRDPNRAKREQEDILDMLLKLQNDPTDDGSLPLHLTEDHIKAILMDIFLGGMDTSATSMAWAMTELTRNSRVMKKVQDEIRKCIGNKGRVVESDLEQLQYLKMVVKESFRLHPPSVLLIPRETMSPIKIDGYNINTKTRVQVNVWAMGRDPDLWENPLKFFPERFMDSPIDIKGQHFELLPFGAGRRGCPALSLGMTMVELALANVLYAFDWKLPNGMKEADIDMEEGAGLVVCKKIPLKLVPLKYNCYEL